MRVALVPSAYAPAIGGVERLTSQLAAQLVKSGHEVEIWTMRHPVDLPAEEVIEGLRVRRFDFYLPPARIRASAAFPVRFSRAMWSLRQASREFRPDVVHVQCFGANGAYALALCELERLPLVVSLQGETFMDDDDIYDRSIALRAALRLAFRRARAVTGCSQFVLNDATRRFGQPAGPPRVIFNGVVSCIQPEEMPVPLPFTRYVAAVGRLVYKKGFDLLLEAFARLPPDFLNVGLVIAGAGPAAADLKALTAQLQVGPRVAFPGPLRATQVAALLTKADVFVLPSRVEPFGIVVLEAMRAGCPIVASLNGGAHEIVAADHTGLLVDPHDTESLAAAITKLLRDTKLREDLASRAAQDLARFNSTVISQEYEAVYSSAVSRSSFG